MILYSAFRGKMVKILSQLSLLMPQTAASEALAITEQIVLKKLEPGQSELTGMSFLKAGLYRR